MLVHSRNGESPSETVLELFRLKMERLEGFDPRFQPVAEALLSLPPADQDRILRGFLSFATAYGKEGRKKSQGKK